MSAWSVVAWVGAFGVGFLLGQVDGIVEAAQTCDAAYSGLLK